MRRYATAVIAVLFFAGWGVWFASASVGYALMGLAAVVGAVSLVRDVRADGGLHLSKSKREQARRARGNGGAGSGVLVGDGGAAGGFGGCDAGGAGGGGGC